MKRYIRQVHQAILILLLSNLSLLNIEAKVVIYPAPKSEKLSSDYSVEVNGKPIPVYHAQTQHHDKKYSIAYFDFSGSVIVKVKSKFSLENLSVLPYKYGISPTVKSTVATFKLGKSCDISFEPDGCNSPLLLFTNNLEIDPPKPNDPNVIYFGAGEHNPKGGLIKLYDGQTRYLEGGAVVKAGIEAMGQSTTNEHVNTVQFK